MIWIFWSRMYYWYVFLILSNLNIQIMGYLSGSSPHIKSGAVSALSVLVYKDTNLCLSISDLVPSLLSLLRTKDVKIIKVSVLVLCQDQITVWAYFFRCLEFNLTSIQAVLGFVKVMVSCFEAKELQSILSDVVTEIFPWSSVSRHHFRSKACIIYNIKLQSETCMVCAHSSVYWIEP